MTSTTPIRRWAARGGGAAVTAVAFVAGMQAVMTGAQASVHRISAVTNPYSPAYHHAYRHGAVPTIARSRLMRQWARRHPGALLAASDLSYGGGVSFFGPLPFAIVEHLASELQSVTYEPGRVITQDGQPGELFYMIADGRARVCKDGKQLRQMGTGESFGEIALLRQTPRTATVIAMSRLQARTLTRDEFLAAVTGNAASAEGADEVVSTRLRAG